jgi:hypothetical protein
MAGQLPILMEDALPSNCINNTPNTMLGDQKTPMRLTFSSKKLIVPHNFIKFSADEGSPPPADLYSSTKKLLQIPLPLNSSIRTGGGGCDSSQLLSGSKSKHFLQPLGGAGGTSITNFKAIRGSPDINLLESI